MPQPDQGALFMPQGPEILLEVSRSSVRVLRQSSDAQIEIAVCRYSSARGAERAQRAGTKVGPTLRTVRLPASAGVGSLAGAVAVSAGAVGAPGFVGCCLIGLPWASNLGCDNAFERCSLTRMSPCSMVSSRNCPSAWAQLWPGLRQLQAALNSVRYLKALGNAEHFQFIFDR